MRYNVLNFAINLTDRDIHMVGTVLYVAINVFKSTDLYNESSVLSTNNQAW